MDWNRRNVTVIANKRKDAFPPASSRKSRMKRTKRDADAIYYKDFFETKKKKKENED